MQISIENFSKLEIEEIRKNFNELEKSLNFKKPRNDINSVHYEVDIGSSIEVLMECIIIT